MHNFVAITVIRLAVWVCVTILATLGSLHIGKVLALRMMKDEQSDSRPWFIQVAHRLLYLGWELPTGELAEENFADEVKDGQIQTASGRWVSKQAFFEEISLNSPRKVVIADPIPSTRLTPIKRLFVTGLQCLSLVACMWDTLKDIILVGLYINLLLYRQEAQYKAILAGIHEYNPQIPDLSPKTSSDPALLAIADRVDTGRNPPPGLDKQFTNYHDMKDIAMQDEWVDDYQGPFEDTDDLIVRPHKQERHSGNRGQTHPRGLLAADVDDSNDDTKIPNAREKATALLGYDPLSYGMYLGVVVACLLLLLSEIFDNLARITRSMDECSFCDAITWTLACFTGGADMVFYWFKIQDLEILSGIDVSRYVINRKIINATILAPLQAIVLIIALGTELLDTMRLASAYSNLVGDPSIKSDVATQLAQYTAIKSYCAIILTILFITTLQLSHYLCAHSYTVIITHLHIQRELSGLDMAEPYLGSVQAEQFANLGLSSTLWHMWTRQLSYNINMWEVVRRRQYFFGYAAAHGYEDQQNKSQFVRY